jgi:hypothetical protein
MTEAPLGCFADALADLDQHQLTRRGALRGAARSWPVAAINIPRAVGVL